MKRIFSKRGVTILFSLLLLVVLVISVVLIVKNSNSETVSMDETIDRAKERYEEDYSNRLKELDSYEKGYDESSLTSDDLDLKSVYTPNDISKHARLILGIISEETEKQAINDLPLSSNALESHFETSGGNKFYGAYTDDVSVNIVFLGMDYSGSSSEYSANVIADVTTYSTEGSITETQNLTIDYNGLDIYDWVY